MVRTFLLFNKCQFHWSFTANVSRPPELFSHPHISPRVGTVKKLAALLDERRVLHIRGTPSSGKTMLARLLWNSCLRYREPVVFVTGWSNISDPQEHLAEQCNAAGYKNVNCVNLLEKNITFILDEAQASYKDHALWFGIIKSQSGCHFGPKLRLFASYGSPTTGPAEYPHGTTPVHLGPAQRVSLTISCVSDSPNVCLFYNEEEFNDVLQRLCSRPWSTFAIAPDARDYLYSMTNGHPGAVDSLVSYMFEVCSSVVWYVMSRTNSPGLPLGTEEGHPWNHKAASRELVGWRGRCVSETTACTCFSVIPIFKTPHSSCCKCTSPSVARRKYTV